MCGSCWAFSAVGAVESASFIKFGQLTRLSEEQVIECATKDAGYPPDYACYGGCMHSAFNYLHDFNAMKEDDYPYTSDKGAWKSCKFDSTKATDISVLKHEFVKKNDVEQLKAAVARQPTSVAVDGSASKFMYYKGGIFDCQDCF